jgi:hypothetical protein
MQPLVNVVLLLARYFDRIGITIDCLINVVFGGPLYQTVSMRCALAARAKKPFGCFMCKVLDIFVQKNHCGLQFVKKPTDPISFVRAGLAFIFAGYVLLQLFEFLWHLI